MPALANIPEEFRMKAATPGEGGNFYILEAGRYPAKIISVRFEMRPTFADKNVKERTLVIQFVSSQPSDDPEHDGKEGRITAWIRWTRYQLVDPKDGRKGGLTAFIDNLFGRKLTQDEIEAFCPFRLEGLKGFVVVSETDKGQAKFNAFRTAKGTVLSPSDFAWRDEDVTKLAELDATSRGLDPDEPVSRPSHGPKPIKTDDLEDPFAD